MCTKKQPDKCLSPRVWIIFKSSQSLVKWAFASLFFALADYEGSVEFDESKMPVFGADNDGFTLTLYNLNYGTNYATQVNENDTQGGTQDDAQEKIIKMIKANPQISTADMASELGISIATVKRKIKKMPNVSYKGSGYSGHWEIKEWIQSIGFKEAEWDKLLD